MSNARKTGCTSETEIAIYDGAVVGLQDLGVACVAVELIEEKKGGVTYFVL